MLEGLLGSEEFHGQMKRHAKEVLELLLNVGLIFRF